MYSEHYLQVLNILLDNAVKYSPDERKKVTISISSDKDFIITAVKDEGMGISKEDVGLIFERFFRADRARTREIGGTGLGLPILYNLIKQYQGDVTVESELGNGTTFTFRIPKAE